MGRIRRWFLFSTLGWPLHCGPATQDQDSVAPAAPPAERESWAVHFELSEPGLRVGIWAPYVRDQGCFTHADSGVYVEFRAADGVLYSSLNASRLTLEGSERIGMGGEVVLRSGDSLEVRTDTLIWERAGAFLQMPDQVRIVASSGTEQGRNLLTNIDLQKWSLEEVKGHWQKRREDQVYQVEIQAQGAVSHRRKGDLVVHYDSVEVAYQGTTLRSPRARFNQGEGTIYFADGFSSTDSLRQFFAREMDFDLWRQRAVARGEVVLSQGDWRLEAEELVEDGERKHLLARGEPALFRQGTRTIEAGELAYAEVEGVLEAQGGTRVVFREGARMLQAAHLIYRHAREHLEARGEVLLQTPELAGVLHSGRMHYDLGAAQMELGEAPRLRRQRSGGELLIRALEMHIDLERQQLSGEGGFRVEAPGLALRAERGLYSADQDRLALTAEVVLSQEEEGNHNHRIQADSMVVDLRDGEIEQIHIPAEVKGSMQASATRVSSIRGTGARVFFQDENLERIDLERGADLTHQHLDEDGVSLIQGERMALYFAANNLQRIQAQGRVEFLSRLPPRKEGQQPSINRVGGEELEIFLEDGSIVEVEVIRPEGSYYPPSTEEQ